MSTFQRQFSAMLVLVALVCVIAPTSAHAEANARAEPLDIDVDILAKIAKERSKANAQKAADKAALGSDGKSDGCGNIGIGNVISGGRPGFQPPREITVVIVGDVVSANNKCK